MLRSFTRSFKPTEPENSTVSVVRAHRYKAIFSNSRSAISYSYSSSLVDSVITGQGSPTTDATNEWTTSSNTISGTTRTLVLTRNFTGGTGDYTFVYNDNALNIIWAYGSGLAMAQHAGTARGSSALGFTLGIDDFSSLNNISIAPNPSNGDFAINFNDSFDNAAMTITNMMGSVVYSEALSSVSNSTQNFDLDLNSGVYIVKVADDANEFTN